MKQKCRHICRRRLPRPAASGHLESQEHITGPRTGNEILKDLSGAGTAGRGIAAMLYCHQSDILDTAPVQWSALWDMQQGIGEYGDFPLHKKQPATLELNHRKLSEGEGEDSGCVSAQRKQ